MLFEFELLIYKIRCDALKFQLRKSQKNKLKMVKKFLEKGVKRKEKIQNETVSSQVSNFSNNNIQNQTKQSQNTHAKKIMAYFLDKNCKKNYIFMFNHNQFFPL